MKQPEVPWWKADELERVYGLTTTTATWAEAWRRALAVEVARLTEDYTLPAIAAVLGVTRQRVAQIRDEGFRLIRQREVANHQQVVR